MSGSLPDPYRQEAVDLVARVEASLRSVEVLQPAKLYAKLRTSYSGSTGPAPTVFYKGYTPNLAATSPPEVDEQDDGDGDGDGEEEGSVEGGRGMGSKDIYGGEP